jgi:acetylornithine deacetylase/succinyl-diaminopimelate desuccinylase-like protein
MTASVSGVIEYARQHGARFLDELFEMLRIPSVGADPAFAADMRRNAEWLAAHLAALGLDKACVMETAGHPVVYGEWLTSPPCWSTAITTWYPR